MKVLIVDDELPARQRLRKFLETEPGVEILPDCENGGQALEAIAENAPDLMFLDIQMPGTNGIDLLRELPADGRPLTVFVTAFDEHAVRAFELHALDYLLKPFRKERLHESVERARALLKDTGAAASRIESLLRDLPATAPHAFAKRLAVRDGLRISVVPVENILYLLASGNYAEVHTKDGKALLMRETMNSLETRLDPELFFRASRSAIVNLSHIVEIIADGSEHRTIILSNNHKVRLTVPLEKLQAVLH